MQPIIVLYKCGIVLAEPISHERTHNSPQIRALIDVGRSAGLAGCLSTEGALSRASSMPQITLSPGDGRLQYSGYVNLELEATRAHFNRQFGSHTLGSYGPANIENGGTRISWRGAAESIMVRLEYTQECRADCSLNLDGRTCYSSGSRAIAGSSCGNQCEATLYVDGREVSAPSLVHRDGRYDGLLEFELPRLNPPSVQRDYTLILPWGAAIDFRGLTLSSAAAQPQVSLPRPPSPAPLRYVAYGDSITHGFCSAGPSYPEHLARLAGWTPVDMGIQGLAASSGADWKHGRDIAQRNPDVVTVRAPYMYI